MSRCAQCGKEVAPQAKFCPSCGKSITATVSSEQPAASGGKPPTSPSGFGGAFSTVRRFFSSLSRWDAAALAGGTLGAGLWYGWSALDVKDKVTPFYIMLIPILIVWFRKPLDRLLLPLQKFKQKIPRLVLIGAGLAVPYFLAHFFYRHGVSNFPLAQKTIIWGTILSYVILRIPDPRARMGSWLSRFGVLILSPWFWFSIAMVFTFYLGTLPALADDFLRDPKRLEDGLRTPGWAQTIAGTAGTVISGLVNGGLIFQRTKPGTPSGDGEGEPKEEPARYSMDVKTEDKRMSLAADDVDRLWVYAKITCSKPSVNSEALTKAISFSFSGKYAEWLSIRSTKFQEGYKAILLAAKPPRPDAELGEETAKVKVTVSGATAEGEPIDVPFDLEIEELTMKVTILA